MLYEPARPPAHVTVSSRPLRAPDLCNDIMEASQHKDSKCYHGDVFFLRPSFPPLKRRSRWSPTTTHHELTDSFDLFAANVCRHRCSCSTKWRVVSGNGGGMDRGGRKAMKVRTAVCVYVWSQSVQSYPVSPSSCLSWSRCGRSSVCAQSSRVINVIRETRRVTLTTACRTEWN